MNFEKLKANPKMPKHIAFIIDGNGRWAKRRGLTRSIGHKAGFENLKKQIKNVQNLGIKNLSVYCFSKENWKRPTQEVDYLMDMFNKMLDEYRKEYINQDIKLMISGDLEDPRLSESIIAKAKQLMIDTKDKTNFVLNICFNYGGRQEILNVVNQIVKQQENKEITEQDFEKYLYTYGLLPLDLVIRTSGEQRTSNFMPWQTTYSEWVFPKKYWPSFNAKDLEKALNQYMKRNRRFGAIKG